MTYQFVQVNEFQANNSGWNLFGDVASVKQAGDRAFQLFSATRLKAFTVVKSASRSSTSS